MATFYAAQTSDDFGYPTHIRTGQRHTSGHTSGHMHVTDDFQYHVIQECLCLHVQGFVRNSIVSGHRSTPARSPDLSHFLYWKKANWSLRFRCDIIHLSQLPQDHNRSLLPTLGKIINYQAHIEEPEKEDGIEFEEKILLN
ncbi:unnamed protein product [Euphydryas editha]|uniref:Uncharacterized protein n=1 Tax=Euphydryas editha TaxID=104508 RepID=A0AAU9TND0_EUPED|nr:unnamed protein product [Euphydryas editha]